MVLLYTYLLKVALCWSVFYLLYVALFRRETFFQANRFYLLGSLITGAVLPLMPLQLLGWQQPEMVSYSLQPIVIGVDHFGQNVAEVSNANPAGPDWLFILGVIYTAGLLIASGRFIWGLWQLKSLRRKADLSNANGYRLYCTDAPHLPFSFFKGLYWSRHYKTDALSRQKIIKHEEAHIFQWHSLDVMLTEICSIMMWWFPIANLYKKEIKTMHEYLADEYVTRWFSKKEYGRLLLRQTQSGMQLAISNAIFSSQLKRRIMMMTRTKSPRSAMLKYLAAIPLLALLLMSFSFGEKQSAPSNEASFHETLTALPTLSDTIPGNSGEEVFKVVEEPPIFAGCQDVAGATLRNNCSQKKLMEFISNNLKYPSEARANGVKGLVVVSFIVEKDGSISSPQVVRSADKGLDQEALRVVQNMPTWIPGKQKGIPVRVQFNIPFRFKLDESDQEALLAAYFPSCADAENRKSCSSEVIMKHLMENLKYPEQAKKEGVQGNVVLKMLIDENGVVEAKEVIKSLSPACDQAAIDAVNSLPKMMPARKGNKSVATEMVLPISFRLPAADDK